MIAARQTIDLRPKLERLDALLLRSAGVDPAALSFEFRPLWQMDAATSAAIALQKAQATQIYAGLNLWPAAVTARLVQSQLVEDGTYPGVEGIIAEAGAGAVVTDFDPAQPRDPDGRWMNGGGGSAVQGADPPGVVAKPPTPHSSPPSTVPKKPQSQSAIGSLLAILNPIGTASAQEIDPEDENRGQAEEFLDPTEPIRIQRYENARNTLKEIDPKNPELTTIGPPGYVPSETDIARLEAAARDASIKRVFDFVFPNGQPIGQPGTSPNIREILGGLSEARRAFDYMSAGATVRAFERGLIARLPGSAGYLTFRPVTSSQGSPAVDINIVDMPFTKLHY